MTNTCPHCQRQHTRPRAAYCSRACSTAAWKAANVDRVNEQAAQGYHRRKAEKVREPSAEWAERRMAIVEKWRVR